MFLGLNLSERVKPAPKICQNLVVIHPFHGRDGGGQPFTGRNAGLSKSGLGWSVRSIEDPERPSNIWNIALRFIQVRSFSFIVPSHLFFGGGMHWFTVRSVKIFDRRFNGRQVSRDGLWHPRRTIAHHRDEARSGENRGHASQRFCRLDSQWIFRIQRGPGLRITVNKNRAKPLMDHPQYKKM